ncbi:hypothetical protein BCV69DRAFT_297993 [Microstroma glucosiphilum]|uniref:Uncharacterized protein n=1 Tax=Pseudomicrostroma glucosiphilum TaxID=1684307 RepID=A0A316UAD6_9BASI|nr:hypothetical protein BCV69DRAFT_297993 [Pseudomicrostroma glucosiphilum]PWN21784.1 hypothetical protein BCV69DRAFT_297993 [Pseudomicrostroma glucosiphilum]
MISRIRSKASARSFSKSFKLDRGERLRADSPGLEWDNCGSSVEADFDHFTGSEQGYAARRSPPPPECVSRLEARGAPASSIPSEIPLRVDTTGGSGFHALHLQHSDGSGSSSSEDDLFTPYHAPDTFADSMHPVKAQHGAMVRRHTDVESSRAMGSSPVDSQDYFKVHWAKTGPVPPARRAIRAKISTTAVSPSPSSASAPRPGLRRAETQPTIRATEISHFVRVDRAALESRADPFDDDHEVTQDSLRVSTATITRGAPSTFNTAGGREEDFSLTSSTDLADGALRRDHAQALDKHPAPVAVTVPRGTDSGREKLKALLTQYNDSVQRASEEIHLSMTSSQRREMQSSNPLASSSRSALPRPLQRLGLDETPLEQRAHLLEGLLKHLIQVHFYEEIVEVFCYGCGPKADDAAKTLLSYLQSIIPLSSLLSYQSRTHTLLSSSLSEAETIRHASGTLTRLHAHIAALLVWVGIVARPSEAASHSTKGHEDLKTARDRLAALCAGTRQQEEGWAEVTMVPKGERTRAQTIGSSASSEVFPATEERTHGTPVFLVQGLGLTLLPCPVTDTSSATGTEANVPAEEKTYRQLLQAVAEGEGEQEGGADICRLETLLEVQGRWV